MKWIGSLCAVWAVGASLGCGEPPPPSSAAGYVGSGTTQPPAPPVGTSPGEAEPSLTPFSLFDRPDAAFPTFLDLAPVNASLSGAVGEFEGLPWRADTARGVGWNPTFASFLLDASADDVTARVGFDLHASNLLHILRPDTYVHITAENTEIVLSGGRNEDETPADLGPLWADVKLSAAGADTTRRALVDGAESVELWIRDGSAEGAEMIAEVLIQAGDGQQISARFGFFPAQCTWGI